MIKRVDESLKRFTKEYDKILFYNKEEFQKRAAYEEGKNDGYVSGKKEIAKTMLKKYSIEEIIAITGLSKEEIESLKEENKDVE